MVHRSRIGPVTGGPGTSAASGGGPRAAAREPHPGHAPNRSDERFARVPGSREAPRSRPTLGRHASLVGNGGETRIGELTPTSRRSVSSRAGLAIRVGAGVGAGDRVHHHLVDAVRRRELRDPGAGRLRARRSPSAAAIALDQVEVRPAAARPSRPPRPAAAAAAPAPVRSASIACSCGSASRRGLLRRSRATDGVDGEEGARLGELRRGPERRAVQRERLGGAAAGEVVGEDVGHALLGRQPGGVVRRAEQPDRRHATGRSGVACSG